MLLRYQTPVTTRKVSVQKLLKRKKSSKESRQKLFKKINGLFRSSKRWRNNFLDLEAEEDDAEGRSSSEGSEKDDEYRYSDSFIDDSEVHDDANMADPDAPFPGLELEDFARQADEARRNQVEDDRCMARAITRHTAMVQSALAEGNNRVDQTDISDNVMKKPGASNVLSNSQATTEVGVLVGPETTEVRESSSSEDEFGVKFYRAQFREAIRRSRQAHERRLAEERNTRDGASSRPGPSTPSPRDGFSRPPPAYDSLYTSPLPAYTPTVPAAQMVTPPNSSSAVPQAFPAAVGTPSGNSGSGNDHNGSGPSTGGQPRRLRFSFPERCEVTDAKLHDVLLAGDYASLVPLRRGSFVPWSNAPGRGLVRFSAWTDQAPSMDPAKAFQAIRLQRCQEFINPSRASPAELEVKEITGGLHSNSFRLHAYLNGQPAICVSSVYSESSCLRTLTAFGLPQNMLQGKLHTQEFDRLVGFFCMSFGIPELHANLSRDSMHYVTRPVSRDNSSSQGSAPGMFSNNPSPSTKRPIANRLLVDHFALDSRNDVPIYDARGTSDFNFTTDLPSMASKLPVFTNGEIPCILSGNVDDLDSSTRFRFIAYTRPERQEEELAENPTAVACSLSPGDLARALLQKLLEHECSADCGQYVSFLVPCQENKEDAKQKTLAKGFALRELREWLDDQEVLKMSDDTMFTLVGLTREQDWIENGFIEPGFTFVKMPWTALLSKLTKAGLQEIARFHGIEAPVRRTRAQLLDDFRVHQCDPGCFQLMASFTVQRKRCGNAKPLPPDDNSPFVWEEFNSKVDVHYPPMPINRKDVARCVEGYTGALETSKIEEFPCASCAQLVRLSEALPFDKSKDSLSVLEVSSVAVLERKSSIDPIEPLRGPILVPGASIICGPCDSSLSKGKMPLLALANGLWIGEVPNELKDLTLGERALIARVRRNRTLVRVSNGHYKMVANVIAFPNPTIKVYEKLPPHRSDIDDVLAVIFTGVSPPTDDDLKRTPVMVNHCDYYDLEIDHEALLSYAEEGVPVGVLHRQMSEKDGNVLGTAKAVFDDGEERGAEEVQ
ncbi:ATP-dependent DNA helicase PIF1 [Coprinopsis cinerea AmutBmut pab1-1]|nr:ATP-dependent DNA helicase PIF1 [Coprinopsis cinerea AmutBmut pab1-1]